MKKKDNRYIKSQGKKNSRLNIITPEFTFDNWKLHVCDSGQKLADIIFGLSGNSVNLSLKNDKAQTTGLGCAEILRRGFKEWFKTGNKPNEGLIWYNGFCKRLGLTDEDFYNWYIGKEQSLSINPNNEQLSKFAACIIGGGYYYINSNGTIIHIPNDYDLPKCEFYELRKAKPRNGKDIKTIYLIGRFNGINCKIVMRSSDGKPFPHRFFIRTDKDIDLENIYKSLKRES